MDDIGKAGQVVGVVYSERQSLDTVRALHQTVVSLRAALEQSRAELHSLRRQIETKVDSELYKDTIEKLSLENHILRRRVLSSENINYVGFELGKQTASSMSSIDKLKPMEPPSEREKEESKELPEEQNGVIEQNVIENGEEVERSVNEDGDQSVSSATSQHGAGTPLVSKGESEDSEELDDIELIFTTDDTKELSALQEDLVSFAETEVWHSKGSEEKETQYRVVNSNLKHTWTQSVLVETDISKCGVVDDNDTLAPTSRRNTLPNATPYRPIIHREALSGSKSQLLDATAPTSPRPVIVKFSQHNAVHSPRNTRPILVEKNSTKQESEAQTDITALPAHWKSESFLAHHKVSHNFTTLPSKFSLPIQSPPRKQSLKLSEKTQEARRVLLSDINFTSMVPELSRSADHLCNETINASSLCKNYPRAFTYMKNADSVMSPGYLGRTPWSPCDCNHRQQSWEYYQGSMVSISSPSATDLMETSKRRHSMRPSTSSLDTYWTNTYTPRPNWSVPTSPTHCRRSRSVPFSTSYTHSTPQPESSNYLSACRNKKVESKFSPISSARSAKSLTASKGRNRVTFQEINVRHPGHSLPDLRLPLGTESGEDSTDSLIDESEEFLRRSIDSMLTGVDYNHIGRRRRMRRHSDPDPVREFEPPKSAQPFLAKIPRDLKLDYWVKVITAEGRVVMGRVRYVGPLPQQNEIHIGVQLAKADGNSDGMYNGRRYFDCEPDFGIFVPFKKVVMAWST